MEENFLLLFRFDNPLESSVEFMKVRDIWEMCILKSAVNGFCWQIWREYDTDGSGYIEADELKVQFLSRNVSIIQYPFDRSSFRTS